MLRLCHPQWVSREVHLDDHQSVLVVLIAQLNNLNLSTNPDVMGGAVLNAGACEAERLASMQFVSAFTTSTVTGHRSPVSS